MKKKQKPLLDTQKNQRGIYSDKDFEIVCPNPHPAPCINVRGDLGTKNVTISVKC
jgi:hypothetical protein